MDSARSVAADDAENAPATDMAVQRFTRVFRLYPSFARSTRPEFNLVRAPSRDIVLHLAFRYDEARTIANAMTGGAWQSESAGPLPQPGQEVTLAINATTAELLFDDAPIFSIDLPGAPVDAGTLVAKSAAGLAFFTVRNAGAGPTPLEELGFDNNDWTASFEPKAYIDLNPDLAGVVSHGEALAHFVTSGIHQLRQFSIEEWLDFDFYLATSHGEDLPAREPSAALYRHWLTHGRPAGRAPNERLFLSRLGLRIEAIPASFLPERVGGTASPGRDKWTAFAQWLDGQREHDTPPPFARPADCAAVLVDAGHLNAMRGEHAAAARMLLRGLLLDDANTQGWYWLGESYAALAQDGLAALAFRNALRAPEPDYWTYVHARDTARRMGQLELSLACARDVERRFPERLEARSAREDAVRALFERNWHEAIRRFIETSGQSGVAQFAQQLDDLSEWHLTAEPAVPVRRETGQPRVAIFANHHLHQCYRYRVAQKAEQLEELGYNYRVFTMDDVRGFRDNVHAFDVCIVFRLPWLPAIAEAINYARSLGVTTIYDVDDLIFKPAYFPPPLPTYGNQLTVGEYAQLAVDVGLYERAVALCDYGMASTAPLQAHVADLVVTRQCFLHRNGYDSQHTAFDARWARRGRDGAGVVIFYGSGTKAHNDAFDQLAAPALAALLHEHPTAKVVIAGYLTVPAALAAMADRIVVLEPVWQTDIYYELLATADISIAPLLREEATDCKSEIKWLEAAMVGIPSVVSDTPVYREAIEDGVDGMIAASPEEWTQKLATLLVDAGLRRRMGAAARQNAARRYSRQELSQNLAAILAATAPPSVPTGPRKRTVALVNVFFWPQMIGGATRVVHDNLTFFMQHYADQCDFEVFCASEGGEPYAMEVFAHQGCRVTRINAPAAADADWRVHDARMGEAFEQWLRVSKPDLVHFHCIQRLTGSVVDAAIRCKIPYVVTLHDAWWVADSPFLLNTDGEVDAEPIDVVAAVRDRKGAALPGIARLVRLRRLLGQAARVLTVSDRFAALYRDFGIVGVDVIANGVSRFGELSSHAHQGGAVRLALVGGMQAHKGLPLVRAALHAARFENLALLVVDHSRGYGSATETTVWGTTPVEIVGRIPQERIGELYGRCDVLLAPSLWPESYGLVTREAISAGLWVIASDRGAIGDAVVEGVNGFVIGVDDTRGLVDALRRIDADPRRYRSPPASVSPLRTADQQGSDLWELYRTLLAIPAT